MLSLMKKFSLIYPHPAGAPWISKSMTISLVIMSQQLTLLH
jgi:hypothetical protein